MCLGLSEMLEATFYAYDRGEKKRHTKFCFRSRHDAIAFRNNQVPFHHCLGHSLIVQTIDFGQGNDTVAISTCWRIDVEEHTFVESHRTQQNPWNSLTTYSTQLVDHSDH